MTLTHAQRRILEIIAKKPRSLNYLATLTDEPLGYAVAVQRYLDALVGLNLLEPPLSQNGTFHITDEGRAYLAALPQPASSRSFVQREVWKPPKWTPARANADEHRQYKSLTPAWNQEAS